MKISLITSGLEPGMDGVGDHVQCLAKTLRQLDHSCIEVALNDRYVELHASPSVQLSNGNEIRRLRVAKKLAWRHKRAALASLLKNFSPDWIGLQFVPHAWHPRGLAVRAAYELPRVLRGKKKFLMIHEIAEGLEADARLKNRLIGAFQKSFVTLRLLKALQPELVFTSNAYYRDVLVDSGCEVQLLPLFSHIEVLPYDGGKWLELELERRGLLGPEEQRGSLMLIGLFGGFTGEALPDIFFEKIASVARLRNQRPVLLSAGKRSAAGDAGWENAMSRHGSLCRFVSFGFLPEINISQYLHGLDFGISATQLPIIGKSSSTAAMLEHGLPVIVTRSSGGFRGLAAHAVALPEGCLNLEEEEFVPRALAAQRRESFNGVIRTASNLIEALQAAERGMRHLN